MKPLPENIHLESFQCFQKNNLAIRLRHLFAYNETNDALSKPTYVNLEDHFYSLLGDFLEVTPDLTQRTSGNSHSISFTE